MGDVLRRTLQYLGLVSIVWLMTAQQFLRYRFAAMFGWFVLMVAALAVANAVTARVDNAAGTGQLGETSSAPNSPTASQVQSVTVGQDAREPTADAEQAL